jgi:6-phosphogluconate dehydrogenase
MMIGGEKKVIDYLDSIFASLAPRLSKLPRRRGGGPPAEWGYMHAGSNGAHLFVKMVHNGMEHVPMQAYVEGFEILKSAGTAVSRPCSMRVFVRVRNTASRTSSSPPRAKISVDTSSRR